MSPPLPMVQTRSQRSRNGRKKFAENLKSSKIQKSSNSSAKYCEKSTLPKNSSKKPHNKTMSLSKAKKRNLSQTQQETTTGVDQLPLTLDVYNPRSNPPSAPASLVNAPINKPSNIKCIFSLPKRPRKLIYTQDVLLEKFHKQLINLYAKHETQSLSFRIIYKAKFINFNTKKYWLDRLRNLEIVKYDFVKQEITCLYRRLKNYWEK